jgi:sulfate transport system ATP-binding protein
MVLTVEGIVKRFGAITALGGVSLEARDGEFLALLGPSGSGKTTLLRVLAGLDRPDQGRVLLDGQDFLAMSARQRRVGLVFQHYALFRHMTVEENIAFGLRVRPARSRPSRAAIGKRVAALLELVQIEGLGKRYPAQLSGGERQRVAVARALAPEPRLLLLDEPFGALDSKVRKELRAELRWIHDATRITTVFVTHDQEEAMALADRVALMNAGRIEQIGAPVQLDETPASPFVFEFLGECNRLACELVGGEAHCKGFTATVFGRPSAPGLGTALFRPAQTRLAGEGQAEGLAVVIVGAGGRGSARTVRCMSDDGALFNAEVAGPGPAWMRPGARARLTVEKVVFEPGPGAAAAGDG